MLVVIFKGISIERERERKLEGEIEQKRTWKLTQDNSELHSYNFGTDTHMSDHR